MEVYYVPIRVQAYDRSGLLRDVTSTIDRLRLSISSINSGQSRHGKVDIVVGVEVRGIEDLRILITRLRSIPNVIDVERIFEETKEHE